MAMRTTALDDPVRGVEMSKGEIEPESAYTAADFVALLRLLKERSGLTYRQLERRASQLGERLPHSTISTAFNRRALPRHELVASIVLACGEEPETVAAWVRAR